MADSITKDYFGEDVENLNNTTSSVQSSTVVENGCEVSLPQIITNKGRELTCCIHIHDQDSNKKVVFFNKDSLRKCHKTLKFRQDHNLKYSNAIIPNCLDGYSGSHKSCYKTFTSLSKLQRKMFKEINSEEKEIEQSVITPPSGSDSKLKDTSKLPQEEAQRITRSSITSPKPSARTGVFPSYCLFCSQARKRVKGVEQKLVSVETKQFKTCIQQYAEWLEDRKMIARLAGVDFAAKEIKYHACCRVKYQTEAEGRANYKKLACGQSSNLESSPGFWHLNRMAHQKAFEALLCYLQEVLIEKKEVLLLREINDYYQHLLKEFGGEELDCTKSTTQKLEEKLKKHYTEKVKVVSRSARGGNIVFTSNLSLEEAILKLNESKSNFKSSIREIALLLREEIFKEVFQPLPENIKLEHIEKGEVEIPKNLSLFFQYLICGPDSRRWKNESKEVRINSISADCVFASTSGKRKPAKHLMLGSSLKSLTGSRKIIEIMNKLGHCASYHTIKELETEMTYEATKNQLRTPCGMRTTSEFGTGVAWDNFDRFVNTMSGKDTLHDTVGIAYQIIPTETGNNQEEQDCIDLEICSNIVLDENNVSNISQIKRKRRRTYEPKGLYLQPYRKKPRMKSLKLLNNGDDQRLLYENEEVNKYWKEDILWMASYSVNPHILTPLWAGWNAKIYPVDKYKHKIWYLPQINESPTNMSVVAETLRRSLDIADEAGKNSIAVTYDLAIAKMAMQLQMEEAPKYDKVFVAMGSFHIEMAFFKALGKIVAESGGPYILHETDALAKGSINSFLLGTSYGRCKRWHEILAVSFEILHFEQYISLQEDKDDLIVLLAKETSNIMNKDDSDLTTMFNYNKETCEAIERYKLYSEETKRGDHGKTAQFWFQYVYIIHLYHEFIRSIRTGDLKLYITCLPKVTNLFFALNHPNYARWLVKYYDALIKLSDTHPEVYNEFQKGWFALRRTDKTFSSIPIDLTLEQTVNSDAASQSLAISSITNSIGARQLWAESHFLRTTITSALFDQIGLSKKEDISQYLRPTRMKKDNNIVNSVVKMIKDTMDPFTVINKENLFNLATGKSVSKETENFLLSINSIGDVERKKFIKETCDRPERFEERIKRQKLLTFASEQGKRKVKTADGKTLAACFVRDLFGSLLYLSLESNIDLNLVLEYPLTPVPHL